MDKFLPQITAANVQQQQQQMQTAVSPKAFSVSEENRHYLKVFIQTYHNLPILWDTTLRDYTNRDKRADAYQQLVPIYKYLKRDATLEDVKKKINTLRTNYRKELKVVEAARKNGSHYQPRCWTFYELDFLRNAEKFLAIDIKNESSSSSSSTYNQVFNDSTITSHHFLDSAGAYGYRTSPPSITEMFHKSFGHQQQQQASATQQQRTEQIGNQNTSPLGLPGGIQNNESSNEMANYTPPTTATPTTNPNKRLKSSSSSTPDDMLNMACDYLASTYPEEVSIARTWTHKLKRLPREQRLLAEKFINDILFEAESGTLHRGSMQLNANEPYVRFEESQTDDSNQEKPQSPNIITTTTTTSSSSNVAVHHQSPEEARNVDNISVTSNENSIQNNSSNANSTFNSYT